MSSFKYRALRRKLAMLLASSLATAPLLRAQQSDSAAVLRDLVAVAQASQRSRPTHGTTVEMIKRMVAKGAIGKEEGQILLAEAEAEAAQARAHAALVQAALAQLAATELRARATVRAGRIASSTESVNTDNAAALESPEPDADRENPRSNSNNPASEDGVESAVPDSPHASTGNVRSRDSHLPFEPVDQLANDVGHAPADPMSGDELAAAEPPRSARPAPSGKKARNAVAEDPMPREEDAPPVEAGEVRVSYVPENVKAELREEIKQEVLAQARAENWASPRTLPDWTMMFRLFGDLRVRHESSFYPIDNATGNGSQYWSFNAINTASAPFDYVGLANPPYANTTENRRRERLRARLAMAIDLSENFFGGLRIATGDNNGPVSQNQTMGGAANGQGGNFSKYALWLDRAFVSWELWGQPDKDLTIFLGRFDNPFFSTNMVWSEDIGFDGLAAKWKFPAGESITPFVTAGAFPVFNTELNFGTNNPTKFKSYDKWLYATQAGATFELGEATQLKVGAAYYQFKNIEGRVSTAFTPVTAQDAGDTDASRPAFAQRGNTYIALRDILLDSTNSGDGGVKNQWQYFGLATPFREMEFTAQLEFNQFAPLQISLFGDYVKNRAFNRAAIIANGPSRLKGPVNNNAADGSTFAGSGSGWHTGIRVGHAALEKRWDWNVAITYRNVGSDAVVDGFTDSDFGGGGTNLKGFTLLGNVALGKRVWFSAKWMSATQIAGPIFKNDIVQADINAKF